MTVAYVDSSALVKLVIPEAESEDLERTLGGYDRTVSSELTVIELSRAGLRADGRAGLYRADEALDRLQLQPIDRAIIDRARTLEPTGLRSLDAIHLASALESPAPPVLVAYDERLLEAARQNGLETSSPGRG